MDGRLHKDEFINNEYLADEFVKNPHITMAHCSQLSQDEMKQQYGPILDQYVSVKVTGLLWNARIAALSVEVASETTTGALAGKPLNPFPHMTLWHTEDVSPVESNELPHLLSIDQASQVILPQPALLEGKLSFWGMDQH